MIAKLLTFPNKGEVYKFVAEEVKRKKERKAVLKRATSQRCHQRPFGFTWRDNYERARRNGRFTITGT